MIRDEDIYRDEAEIEKEKTKKGTPVCEEGFKGNTLFFIFLHLNSTF